MVDSLMTESSFWLVLAGLLLVAEITTGTFYLLMVSIGAAMAAGIAHLEYAIEYQIAAAAVFSLIALLALQHYRNKNPVAQGDDQRQLDLGNMIEVSGWNENGLTKVLYRGAQWSAHCADETPQPGLHIVVEVNGNTLILQKK